MLRIGKGTVEDRATEMMRRNMAREDAARVVQSSGNVFADLGLPDAAELDTKVRLCAAINRIVERRRLTQAAAANALG